MKQYYIQLFSPHGLIRFNNPEIGRDTDTGGQVKYLLELLDALSNNPRVRKVDLSGPDTRRYGGPTSTRTNPTLLFLGRKGSKRLIGA